jgi:tetratricopeptide (TPR) repeat protein
MASTAARAQDEAQQAEQPPLSSAEQVIELNRGIQAFLEADFERASEIFERVLAADAGNPACLYYLGLIHLDEGLQLSSVDNEAAQAKFNLACENLEQVMQSVDPTVAPVEAALLLGIAQLAADVPTVDTGTVIELAVAAQRTLQSYVETIEAGKNDRYGFFYLGVAHYRLGDHYSLQGDHAQASSNLTAAVRALETAERLAEVDRKRDELEPGVPRGLDQAGYEQFKRVVTYYRGLVALQRRQNREARRLLEYVSLHERGELGQNATGILEKLNETEAESPLPLSLDSPLGPLDVQGDLWVGGAYDTNVILLGQETTLPLGIGQKYDFRAEIGGNFYVSRYIDKTEAAVGESLSIGLGGGTAHGWHPDVHEFDINLYAGRAFVQWQPLKDWYLGAEYEYAYTKLGTQPFISGNRVTPVLSHIWRSDSNGDELGPRLHGAARRAAAGPRRQVPRDRRAAHVQSPAGRRLVAFLLRQPREGAALSRKSLAEREPRVRVPRRADARRRVRSGRAFDPGGHRGAAAPPLRLRVRQRADLGGLQLAEPLRLPAKHPR